MRSNAYREAGRSKKVAFRTLMATPRQLSKIAHPFPEESPESQRSYRGVNLLVIPPKIFALHL